MAARLVAAAAAVAVAALLAGGAYVDCFETCFKNCISNDKSMADYCNYACSLTCGGGGGGSPNDAIRRPIDCQFACVRDSCRPLRADGKDMEACYGQCYDGCKTKASLPRPLGVGATGDVVWPAALPDHPFHKTPEAVKPTSEPDPDDFSRRASGPLLP
ncbi:hypothetical protein HU200_050175 [Digitaria exilis]|uniref:Uncharacterized protein n=1 Tax=Digitaria exilis TaxID=1010633 RepID=A0A835E7Q7_9POAL|nr:hypothetical protein HU200_050175 [Digitaria exilis]CAB3473452.1 unnamed protein product [Digitaria exilis]